MVSLLLAQFAANAMTEKMNKFSNPAGPAGIRRDSFGRLIHKCLALTISVQAPPAAHPQLHGHDGSLYGQILKKPKISAVSAL
jgi:hypothetical protein